MEEVLHRTSLAPLPSSCLTLSFLGLEREGFVDFQGRVRITSIVQWNLRPVIFGVEFFLDPKRPAKFPPNFPAKIGEQKTVPLVSHAFARGTPAIFVIFVVSRGLSSKALDLLVRTQIRHFRRFRPKPPLFRGTKARSTKSTVSWTPKKEKSTDELVQERRENHLLGYVFSPPSTILVVLIESK